MTLEAKMHSGASRISFVVDIMDEAGSNMENMLAIMIILGSL